MANHKSEQGDTKRTQPLVYQIRLRGHLGGPWSQWFGGLAVTLEEDGDTLLTGPVSDQAALHGLLRKVRDLGVPLVSLLPVEHGRGVASANAGRAAAKRVIKVRRNDTVTKDRRTATIVGVLYIIGTLAGVLSVVLVAPLLRDPQYLVKVAEHRGQMTAGTLLVLIMGLALAMVPVTMFPVSRRHSEVLALGYVVFRGGVETVIYIAMAITRLLLLIVGLEYARAGALDASHFQTLGALFLQAHDSIDPILGIVFPLGALMLYSVFYQSRLIPRWLSGWGLAAAVLWLATALFAMFGLIRPMSAIQTVLALPIGLQEMVMAVWLIVRGFSASAIGSGAAEQGGGK